MRFFGLHFSGRCGYLLRCTRGGNLGVSLFVKPFVLVSAGYLGTCSLWRVVGFLRAFPPWLLIGYGGLGYLMDSRWRMYDGLLVWI